jgi:spore coat polysaccharide biosynthesis protein SpsF
MTTVAIVQARMGSSRLPGKVLMDLAGEPMLARCVNRIGRSSALDRVVVATSDLRADDPIRELCAARGWDCFSGSESDVLDRYYHAAKEYKADAIVRITSDCPLIEPEVADQIIETFLERFPAIDYASNTVANRTFPRGLDVEVFSFAALERAWTEDTNPGWREHVTPYIYRSPHLFKSLNVTWPTDYSRLRWTVDTAEDLEFVRRIYGEFGHDRFNWREVLALLDRQPELTRINHQVQQKAIV